MVYLLGLLIWWIADAVVPAAAFAMVAGTSWLVLAAVVWRGRSRLRWGGLAVVGVAAAVWLAVATQAVWFRFENPQFAMFRDYVADPIPATVQDLAVASAAPAMFDQAALVRFRAPAAVRDGILAHTLPGSVTRQLSRRTAEKFDRDPAVVARIAGADGGYLRYDPAVFAAFDTPEWAFVLQQLKPGPKFDTLLVPPADRELFVYAERGDWGTLACLATLEHGSEFRTLHVRPSPAGWRR